MDKTTPMKLKPLANVTCKLGTKGCFEDGRCHALGNCENKIVTNADRIRAMSDEELAEFLYGLDHYWDDGQCILRINDNHLNDYKDDILAWLQYEAE